MGVQDIYAAPTKICSIAFITCTHGHGNNNGLPTLAKGLTWTPSKDQRILAVHGTSPRNWNAIVEATALKSMTRDGIHFSVFRPGMVLREISQLKKHGRFVFIDPWAVHGAGFHMTVNINDIGVTQLHATT